jgi:N4-(beta-N-acetylglucosaminyl)-L-asparaginase
MGCSRRDFLTGALVGTLAFNTPARAAADSSKSKSTATKQLPIIVCANNGYDYLDNAFAFLQGGGDTLDAAIRVVKGAEDDPNDTSVGLGGLPNEEGVVELDACCMHGPTRRAGSVGAVHNIRSVASLSKTVMDHTGHVMIVGEGAERFAVAQGYQKENLLTDSTRKIWLLWKETHSDWWGPGLADKDWKRRIHHGAQSDEWQLRIKRMQEIAADIGIEPDLRMDAIKKVIHPPTGTIHCSALAKNGDISGVTTTSGLAWKIPGRLGDSPIIGAGCYTDPDVGSCGATGSGEENIKIAACHTIIENMRHGMSPLDAGMDVLNRIVKNYNHDMERLQYVDVTYYILKADGSYAGVSLWDGYEPGKPHKIAVHDGTKRAEKTVSMFKGASNAWPPSPSDSPNI